MQVVKYSSRDKDLIKQEYLSGKSIAALAIQFAADKTTYDAQKPYIRKILVEKGVKLRRGRQADRLFKKDPLITIERINELVEELGQEVKKFMKQSKPRAHRVKRPNHKDRAPRVSIFGASSGNA